MGLAVPSFAALSLESSRLRLEPIAKLHAEEMSSLLAAPELYRFIPQDPPSLEALKQRYASWEKRASPDGSELWLNWALREKASWRLVGHLQAGHSLEKTYIAYMIGSEFHRRGFAAEAIESVLPFLRSALRATSVKAWVDTRNEPSIALLHRLGFTQVEFLPKADRFRGEDSDEFVFELKLPA